MTGVLGRQSFPYSMTQSNISNTTGQVPFERIPAQLLETFFPGFGLASQFFAAFLGIDLAWVLYSCFVVVAVVVAAQWAWQQLLLIKDDWFTSSITITSNDKLFGAVMDYLSKMVMEKSRTRYLAAISKNSTWVSRGYPYDRDEDDDVDDGTDDDEATEETEVKVKRRAGGPNYGPALGNHWFWHKGHYFGFQREKEGQKQGIILQQSKETITINCLGRSTEPIKKLLKECQDFARQEDRSKMKVCSSARYSWGRPHLRDPRPLDTIYMDHSVKADLLADLKRFLAPSRGAYYRRRGIPYRRGYLLHGPPGTGKTSLVSALAGRLHLELHVLNLMDQGMDEDDLVNLFRELPRRSIVLIEDIDTVGLKRRILPQDFEDDDSDDNDDDKKDDKEKPTETKGEAKTEEAATPKKFSLSGLLNVIDGIASQEGRILIVTSNNPEALDAALVRPGRIDKQIYLGNLNRSSAKEMFMRMYESDPTPLPSTQSSKMPSKNSSSSSLSWDMAADTELERLASEFADALPDSKLSPAEVQGFLLSYEDEPAKAVGAVAKWAEDVIKAREKRKNIVDKPKA